MRQVDANPSIESVINSFSVFVKIRGRQEKPSIHVTKHTESTIDSEGFKGGTRGAPIMPRDAVSRTVNKKLVTIVANRH